MELKKVYDNFQNDHQLMLLDVLYIWNIKCQDQPDIYVIDVFYIHFQIYWTKQGVLNHEFLSRMLLGKLEENQL